MGWLNPWTRRNVINSPIYIKRTNPPDKGKLVLRYRYLETRHYMAHHIISGRNFLHKQIKRDNYSIIILERRIKVNTLPQKF